METKQKRGTVKTMEENTIGPKRNDVQFRLKALEQAADALRLAANDVIRHDERLKTLFGKCEEHDTEIASLRREQVAATEEINKKIGDLGDRFDENKNYFSRWFMILLASLLSGVAVGIAAFILNR